MDQIYSSGSLLTRTLGQYRAGASVPPSFRQAISQGAPWYPWRREHVCFQFHCAGNDQGESVQFPVGTRKVYRDGEDFHTDDFSKKGINPFYRVTPLIFFDRAPKDDIIAIERGYDQGRSFLGGTQIGIGKGNNDDIALHKSAHAATSSGLSQSRPNTPRLERTLGTPIGNHYGSEMAQMARENRWL